MKKVFILLALGAAVLTAASCSFLDEDIRSFSRRETFYKTAEQIRAGLNGCYIPIRSIYNNSNYFVVTEAQSDLIFSNRTDQPNAILNITPSKPQMGSTLWTYGYQGVMRTNAILAAIGRAPLSDEEKAPLYAEGVILRAFYYYILTINFGDVPYYTEEVTDENNDRITHLGRMSASDTRNACIDELYEWILTRKALPMVGTYSADNVDRYRIGAAVGLMLGGKLCLWEERWADAIDFFGALEDIYGNGAGHPANALAKYPLSDIPFYQKYTPESILEMPNSYTDYGLHIYGNLAYICMPQRTSGALDEDDILGDDDEGLDTGDDHTDYYYGIGIPWLGGYSRTRSPLRPNTRFYKELMPYTAAYPDARRAAYNPADGKKIADNGGYMAWGWEGWSVEEDRNEVAAHWMFFNGLGKTSRPYLGNKFWCPGMQYTMDNNNYKIFRFAGALLGLAEAWLMRGDEEKACAYLNAVKSRAGLKEVSPSDFSDADELMNEIRDECGRELFGEFQRKHDLVRWGVWYDYCLQYSNSANLKKNIRPCHRYFPIPDEEITYSGGHLDNKEYNQYGL